VIAGKVGLRRHSYALLEFIETGRYRLTLSYGHVSKIPVISESPGEIETFGASFLGRHQISSNHTGSH
jgi:hypothetical protein